jgi:hypothetical protein
MQAEQEREIREKSKYGSLHTWSVQRFLIKSGDDLRLE